MRRPSWFTDVLILEVFVLILSVLSVVTITTLRQTYEQNEKLQTVNQFVDCLDPTTRCGKKVAEQQEAERAFLINSMQNQAICTLLTSRSVQDEDDIAELEKVYNECVAARAELPPKVTESPVDEDEEEEE